MVVADNSGKSYAVGQANSGDIYITRYDRDGNAIWKKRFDPSHSCGAANSACVDNAGNLYLQFFCQTFNNVQYDPNAGGRTLFGKFDTLGNIVWVKQRPFYIALPKHTDANDEIVAAASTDQTLHLENNITVTTPSGVTKLFIARFDLDGNCVSVLENEGGYHAFKCNANGDKVLMSELYGQNVTLGKGSHQITFTYSWTPGGQGYVAKYNANDTLVWAKEAITCDVAIDDAGNIYTFEPTDMNNMYLVKYDPKGNKLWTRTHLYCPNPYKLAMSCGKNGDLYFTGGFQGTFQIDSTLVQDNAMREYVAKVDSGGNLKWFKINTGSGAAGGKDICVYDGNQIFFTGDMGGDVMLDSITCQSGSGIYVGKIIDTTSTVNVKSKQVIQSELNVFPNPSGNTVNILYSGNAAAINLILRDELGREVLYKQYPPTSMLKDSFSLGNLPKGIYFLELVSNKERVVRKIALE